MGIADFFNQPDWSQRAGTGLQAFGAGLSGRDPNVPIQRYQQGIEREERKGNIASLMQNMGIGGNQRALLDMMPQESQLQSLYDIQTKNRARTDQEAANAAFMASMFPQQDITQTTLPATYSEGLAGTESGGDYSVVNAEGFGGKYQFGQPRLDDYNQATGQNVTMQQFLQNPQIQEAAQAWNVGDTDNYISKNSLDQYIGQNIGGVAMTQDGLRAMAHLGGNNGMRKFLESGGQYNPADSQGTRLSDYAQTHAGGIGSQQPQMGGDQSLGGDPTLLNWMQMAANPNLGAGQKQYLEMMIEQRQGESGGDRETATDINDRLRFVDTGEFVFPDISSEQTYDWKGNNEERDDWEGLTANKEFDKQASAFGRVTASATDPSAAGDLALIFNYMKVLDPGSTVREGEFATAQNSGGVGSRVRSLYGQVIEGTRLSSAQRADFLDRARRLYEDAEREYTKRFDRRTTSIAARGLNPEFVLTDFKWSGQMPPPPPAGDGMSRDDAVSYWEDLQ